MINLTYQDFNGINTFSQLRRSTDMVYQRGESFDITLIGDEYLTSIFMDIDVYVNGERKTRISVVPFEVLLDNGDFIYKFEFRPYTIIQNYIESEHYQYYWLNDWFESNKDINNDLKYKNYANVNFKYGWRYQIRSQVFTEYVDLPENDWNHFTYLYNCDEPQSLDVEDFVNTGNQFEFIGGTFQLQENYLLPNVNQQVGTVIENGQIPTLDTMRNLSRMSQYFMSTPTVPEMSDQARFLTDSPRILFLNKNENHSLSFIYGTSGDKQVSETEYAHFMFFNELNEPMYDFYVDLRLGIDNDQLKVNKLPCGPEDIRYIYANQIQNFDDIYYYTVQIITSQNNDRTIIGGPTSEIFYFYINENCSRESTRLCFLNDRGGYDYYTFRSYRSDRKDISRSTYNNRFYSSRIESVDRNVGRFSKVFDTEVTREVTLETDYLTTQEGNWLEQLYYSPQVYEIKGNYISPIDRQDKVYVDIVPMEIVSRDVMTINRNNQKLVKYRITLKYADMYFNNRGI